MADTDIAYLTLVDLAARLARRDISSTEATQAQLARIAALEPRLHAYVLATGDSALAEAKTADAEIAAGRHRGLLHGVPVAVKDLCDLTGTATTAGMPLRSAHRATSDATVVARLRAAGAVILGKLQMTEGAYGAHHPDVVAPVNPGNAAYWTGVSSSGSGVATAAGMCFASLGSDTGGSIRFPSTMNGLTGLKPTWGRVSRAGVFSLGESLDHIGPMTRSAADCAAVLGAIAGADPRDPTASPVAVPDYLGTIGAGVRGLRIGLDRRLYETATDADSRAAIEHAASVLTAAGATIVDLSLPMTLDVAKGWIPMCAAEAAVAHEATFPARAAEYGPVLTGMLRLGRTMNALDMVKLDLMRARLRGEMALVFEQVDLLLTPVMHVAAASLEDMAPARRTPETVAARQRFSAATDMTGHPALTLPGGFTAAGMPVGFQITGRHFDEAAVLRAGHAFQSATDWHRKHPVL